MSEVLMIGLATVLIGLITLAVKILALVFRTRADLQEYRKEVNHRLDELVAAKRAEGVEEGEGGRGPAK